MIMFDIGILLAIVTAISGAGLALDELLLPRQAKAIEVKLEKFWLNVSEYESRDIPKSMVMLFLKMEKLLFGEWFTIRWFFSIFLVSLFLTSSMTFAARIYSFMQVYADHPEQFTIALSSAVSSVKQLRYKYYIPVNILADQVTIILTIVLLKKLFLNKGTLLKYFAIVMDILICIIIFNVVLFFSLDFNNDAGQDLTTNVFLIIPTVIHYTSLMPEDSFLFAHVFLPSIMVSTTIVLPTLIYLLMILTALLLKSSASIGRATLMHLSALGVEGDKTIFFYSGIFISLILIILKLCLELIKFL